MKKKPIITSVLFALASVLFLVTNLIAASPPPSGGVPGSWTWDLKVTGANMGAAYLTFSDDGLGSRLITGYINVVPGKGKPGQTVIFGAGYVWGEWGYDENGRIVAFLSNDPTQTVRFDVTGMVGNVSKGGERLTLSGETVYGNLKFSGGTAAPLTDLSLFPLWTVIVDKVDSDMTFVEIFFVQPSPTDMNVYTMDGFAANLCLTGSALLSKSNDLVIAIWEAEMPDSFDCADVPDTGWTVGYSAYGHLDLKRLRGHLKGAEEGCSKNVNMSVVME